MTSLHAHDKIPTFSLAYEALRDTAPSDISLCLQLSGITGLLPILSEVSPCHAFCLEGSFPKS